MGKYDEIKEMIANTKSILQSPYLNEEINQIRKSHGLIVESDQINVMDDIKNTIDYETAETDEKISKEDKSKSYRISGGIITLHGKDKNMLNITTEDKLAFQETMDEFVSEVAEIVDFDKLHVYENSVQWSGKIQESDIEYFFNIGESDGVYINGNMLKLDTDFLETINKLKTFYEKFKSKWSKVIAGRKKTKE